MIFDKEDLEALVHHEISRTYNLMLIHNHRNEPINNELFSEEDSLTIGFSRNILSYYRINNDYKRDIGNTSPLYYYLEFDTKLSFKDLLSYFKRCGITENAIIAQLNYENIREQSFGEPILEFGESIEFKNSTKTINVGTIQEEIIINNEPIIIKSLTDNKIGYLNSLNKLFFCVFGEVGSEFENVKISYSRGITEKFLDKDDEKKDSRRISFVSNKILPFDKILTAYPHELNESEKLLINSFIELGLRL